MRDEVNYTVIPVMLPAAAQHARAHPHQRTRSACSYYHSDNNRTRRRFTGAIPRLGVEALIVSSPLVQLTMAQWNRG